MVWVLIDKIWLLLKVNSANLNTREENYSISCDQQLPFEEAVSGWWFHLFVLLKAVVLKCMIHFDLGSHQIP